MENSIDTRVDGVSHSAARVLISAAHKSSGKTTISVGLCAALQAQGQVVQAFKKGPDYIDPMWLGQASGRDCFNLDPFLMSAQQIRCSFERHSLGADICLVEGNKGLYDGLALDGSNSNAALAHLLDLPVVLVLDARGMTRGIAPLILGYQAFDRGVRIAGVILNQVGGARHESKLRAVIEHYTDVRVLGAVAHEPQLGVLERHLGLVPCRELDDARQRVRAIGERIAAQVDLNQLLRIARSAAALSAPASAASGVAAATARSVAAPVPLRIAVARDKAFGFYYPDDLAALQQAGVELVPFDTLNDTRLPQVDAVMIGGGFPEMFAPALQANSALRESLRGAIQAGLPVYAECGGLMYLTRSLRWNDAVYQMVGALPADCVMHARPVGRGYVELQTTPDMPWPSGTACPELAPGRLRGHEFHHASLESLGDELKFAYRVCRGHGVDGQRDGLVYRNVLASWAHLRQGAGSAWTECFAAFVRQCKQRVGLAGPAALQMIMVNGQAISTDVEGYLKNLDDWSEAFALARAQIEGLELTPAHWELIRFLRDYYDEHQVQAQVRVMIRHFTRVWGPERGNNHYLHSLFPIGGPQKQGNRLAGLWKTKGEH